MLFTELEVAPNHNRRSNTVLWTSWDSILDFLAEYCWCREGFWILWICKCFTKTFHKCFVIMKSKHDSFSCNYGGKIMLNLLSEVLQNITVLFFLKIIFWKFIVVHREDLCFVEVPRWFGSRDTRVADSFHDRLQKYCLQLFKFGRLFIKSNNFNEFWFLHGSPNRG